MPIGPGEGDLLKGHVALLPPLLSRADGVGGPAGAVKVKLGKLLRTGLGLVRRHERSAGHLRRSPTLRQTAERWATSAGEPYAAARNSPILNADGPTKGIGEPSNACRNLRSMRVPAPTDSSTPEANVSGVFVCLGLRTSPLHQTRLGVRPRVGCASAGPRPARSRANWDRSCRNDWSARAGQWKGAIRLST